MTSKNNIRTGLISIVLLVAICIQTVSAGRIYGEAIITESDHNVISAVSDMTKSLDTGGRVIRYQANSGNASKVSDHIMDVIESCEYEYEAAKTDISMWSIYTKRTGYYAGRYSYDITVEPIWDTENSTKRSGSYEKSVRYTKATLKKVTEKITSEAASDYEKVKAIYLYIVNNIDYDVYGYIGKREDGRRITTSYETYYRKIGVCSGQASLFSRMCTILGIPVKYITGTLQGSAHAWNGVLLNGRWYEVDVTNAYPGYYLYSRFLQGENTFRMLGYVTDRPGISEGDYTRPPEDLVLMDAFTWDTVSEKKGRQQYARGQLVRS